MNTMTTRAEPVLFDDCDYSDAQELLYEGEPYTGTVVERGPAGQLITEQHFRAGVLDGVSRAWNLEGTVIREREYNFGMYKRWREWHANGQLKRDIRYDALGHVTVDGAWDALGRPIDPASQA
jgi:hypothetical protein